MSKKLTKSEVEIISKRFKWGYKQTLDYIKSCRGIDSVLDADETFRMCYKSDSPIDRFKNISLSLAENCEDFENAIIGLLEGDILIKNIILFNICNFLNDKNIKLYTSYKGRTADIITQQRFSKEIQYISFMADIDVVAELKDHKHLDNYEPYTYEIFKKYLDEDELSYHLCDWYIYKKIEHDYNKLQSELKLKITQLNSKLEKLMPKIDYQKKSDFLKYRNLKKEFMQEFNISQANYDMYYDEQSYYDKYFERIILRLFPILEFRLLRIDCIKRYMDIISSIKYLPEHYNFLSNLKKLFIDINENRNELTEKRYWFYYCLIEKIKEKGYQTKAASEIAENLLGLESKGTLRARYYDKNKEAKKIKPFELDKYIKEHGFLDQINKHLEKVESIK